MEHSSWFPWISWQNTAMGLIASANQRLVYTPAFGGLSDLTHIQIAQMPEHKRNISLAGWFENPRTKKSSDYLQYHLPNLLDSWETLSSSERLPAE